MDINGWRICSIRGNQLHATSSGVLAAAEIRIILSQASGPIWSNAECDDAALYNAAGQIISYRND